MVLLTFFCQYLFLVFKKKKKLIGSKRSGTQQWLSAPLMPCQYFCKPLFMLPICLQKSSLSHTPTQQVISLELPAMMSFPPVPHQTTLVSCPRRVRLFVRFFLCGPAPSEGGYRLGKPFIQLQRLL